MIAQRPLNSLEFRPPHLRKNHQFSFIIWMVLFICAAQRAKCEAQSDLHFRASKQIPSFLKLEARRRNWYYSHIHYRTNNQIISRELRVIDERGENLGVMKKEDALRLAGEKGFDLIEIVPTATPPVARIMSFDKFRYEQDKEEKRQRQAQRPKELKEIRITARAAHNDLQIRAKKADDFLREGHKVTINLFLRGREKANKEWALQKMEEFLKIVSVPYAITMAPKQGGRGYIAQITKK